MPKMKTHRGAAKRFKVTGTGKIKRKKAYKSHILTKKTTKRKRNLRKLTIIDKSDYKRVKELLPYSF
ncbi:MAG TPA: 50S ribosomal protein L35 [Candidatus Atribacteria bacterium]|nr:50S ribosomal protein L35 [Candidatus Atribacteria bacterium]